MSQTDTSNDSRSSNDRLAQRRARRRVSLKMGFATHAFVYLCVNLGLLLFSLASPHSGARNLPLMGWGLGLGIHGLVVFWRLNSDGWRERLVSRELRRLQGPAA